MNEPGRAAPRRWLVAMLCGSAWLATILTPAGVFADELAEFQIARGDYDAQRYDLARTRFQAIVRQTTVGRENRPILLESRKYLGACHLFLGERGAAEAEFLALLRADPEYLLDPASFPGAVLDVFREVRRRFAQTERERAVAAHARQQQRERRRLAKQKRREEREARLLKLARTETVERENSRFVAALPFGVGQIQNGHRRLGIVLASVQAILGALSLTTFLLHQSLRDEEPGSNSIGGANRAERAFRVTNWVSTGLFLGTAIGGIIDAQVRFRPVIRSTRERRLGGLAARGVAKQSTAVTGFSFALQLRY